ncbi:hypothetical protein LR48_Vigan05g084200 [Vigna angularis]|uniref:Uncharacterized protein n=1 Tax=Phaseolus angularis TaxID=3914 RepID=A0A0L9UKF0_PHAAN|nr:hypothetical protein LR48_Vigan05g084200 [Vigna angularis]
MTPSSSPISRSTPFMLLPLLDVTATSSPHLHFARCSFNWTKTVELYFFACLLCGAGRESSSNKAVTPSISTHGSTIPAFESLLLPADREGGYVCCHQRAFSFPFIHGFSFLPMVGHSLNGCFTFFLLQPSFHFLGY